MPRKSYFWQLFSGKPRRRPFFGFVPVLDSLETRILLTEYVVSKAGDTDDGDYSMGQLTIREAVNLANANPGPDLITSPGAVTNSPLTITDDLEIRHEGTQPTSINNQLNGPALIVEAGVVLTVSNLRISGSSALGGAIRNEGELHLSNCWLDGGANLGSTTNDVRGVVLMGFQGVDMSF